jgi:restriction system protein
MARRRKSAGLAELLIASPWWVSIVFGCVAFIALRWVIPSIVVHNPFLTGIAKLSQSVAWLFFLGFGIIAAISLIRSKLAARSSFDGPKGRERSIFNVTGDAVKIVEWKRMEPVESFMPLPEPVTKFDAWSLDALRSLEWKRFELLTAKYYEAVGFDSKTIRCGADGGIDVKLFKIDSTQPVAIVQCKAWNASSVGVKEVRELLGVMTHEKVSRGIFITTGTYTKDALNFCAANPIQLLDGTGFLSKIKDLSIEQQNALLHFAFEGDFKTPTCASCGIKMTKRDSKRGPFWGCLNYPSCRSTFAFKR